MVKTEHTTAPPIASLRTAKSPKHLPFSSNSLCRSKSSFSQASRCTVMQDNIRLVQSFMNAQQGAINQLFKQFQLFSGYLEQLPPNPSAASQKHAWSVYLMHAQAVDSSLRASFKNKPLFGDGGSPPVRVHLEFPDGLIKAFDVPDPALFSVLSIRSFLSGVVDHHLPSIELCNACMMELLDALSDIHQGREELSRIAKQMKRKERRLKNSHHLQNPNLSHINPLGGGFLASIKQWMDTILRPFRQIRI